MFTIGSMQQVRKSENRISAIGRAPAIAAPTADPTMAYSLIGVSTIRFLPSVSTSPAVTAK